MAKQFSFGRRPLRTMLSLSFLTGLVLGSLCSQAATAVPPNKAYATASEVVTAGPTCPSDTLNPSGSTLSRQLEIGACEDFGLALEDSDSIHLLRVRIRQRTVHLDREAAGLTISSTNARNLPATISPPLLV
ncbi:MAG: hypothetical protein DMF06_10200 [Verrucomicrobia bacterium]|nr:MAG: hypothetical protein DMF06_10200 [Verrucomicrobiota bacterium]